MRALDCCQSRTSPVSRKSQPFPTMPCFEGAIPVSIVAWAVHVTAGRGPRHGWALPSDEIRGAWAASFGVSPTTLRTQTLAIGDEYNNCPSSRSLLILRSRVASAADIPYADCSGGLGMKSAGVFLGGLGSVL